MKMIDWNLLEKWDVICIVGGIVFVINAIYYLPKLVATIADNFDLLTSKENGMVIISRLRGKSKLF